MSMKITKEEWERVAKLREESVSVDGADAYNAANVESARWCREQAALAAKEEAKDVDSNAPTVEDYDRAIRDRTREGVGRFVIGTDADRRIIIARLKRERAELFGGGA